MRRPKKPPAQRQALADLQLFNDKVDSLENSGLIRRFADAVPEVLAEFVGPIHTVTEPDGLTVSIYGQIRSRLPDLNDDEVKAFVLTYRLFTQDNDRISIASLDAIYRAAWMPAEAEARFSEAHTAINQHLAADTFLLIGAVALTARKILDVTIYGVLAHTNRQKEKEFQSWAQAGITGFVWAEFIIAIKQMLDVLVYLRGLNAAVIQDLSAEP